MVEEQRMGRLVTSESPATRPFWEYRDKQVKKAKANARAWGFEVLTPLAAAELFNITPAAGRAARGKGKVYSPFALWMTDREVDLTDLQSALVHWKRHADPQELEPKLDDMRESGHTLAVDQKVYNLLDIRPLVSLSNASELEGANK